MRASMAAPSGFAIVARTNGATRLTWRKVHLAVDEATLEVRAVEFTDSSVGPSRQIASQSPAGRWTRRFCPPFVTGPGG